MSALTTNIIAYYKLDESSGTAADSVASNNLTNTSTVTYAPGKISNAAVLATTGQRLGINSTLGLTSTSAFSFSFWVKMSSEISSSGFYFLSLQLGSGQGYENLSYEYNGGTRRVTAENSGARATATLGTDWNHIVYTRASGGSGATKIYVNGVLGATVGAAAVIGGGSADFNIPGTSTFEHMIDEVGVWSRELTSTEAADLYSMGQGLTYPFLLIPILTTEAVSDIDLTTATGNGTVVSDRGLVIIERGFVWGTSPTPTIADSSVAVSGTTGAYSGDLTFLTLNTTYYVRAYATNFDGTGYGNEVSFSTLPIDDNKIAKDINGVEGEIYAVSVTIGGTLGTLTVSLGTTGSSQTFAAGAGVVTLQGTYGGLSGLIFEASPTFNGYIDNVMWVLVLGSATIDWSQDSLTNVYPIDSSVVFRRFADKDFGKFRIYRYLDVQFKDLDGYITVLLKKEANEDLEQSTKEFLVSNVSGEVLPFIDKRLSMLVKSQALRIGFSNARLNETFTICQFVVKGMQQQRKTFDPSKIISIS